MATLRIPFAEAIEEPRLLKPRFYGTPDLPGLSVPQRVALKVLYGCPLDNRERDERGFTELEYYWASQGYATYDEVGYITGVTPPDDAYDPHEYSEGWGIWGIRAGKSDTFAATIMAYEATCGGHEEFKRKGKRIVCFQIAQDLGMAQYALHGIRATIESMPFFKGAMTAVTARRIDLKNEVSIITAPPTVKAVRGYDSPVGVLDEVGVWYQEADSANPDFEIYRQIVSRQAQFEFPKIVGISSPWNKAGMLYQRFEAGTDGRKLLCDACRESAPLKDCPVCASMRSTHVGRLIMHGTTAGLGNPLVSRKWLKETQQKDPKAFARECLAQFLDSLSGFLDTALLRGAVERGVISRPPEPRHFHVAAMDPAFRRDAFGFCIGHVDDQGRFTVDVTRRWVKPDEGNLNPRDVFAEMAPLLKAYGIVQVATDQYHFDSLQQLALEYGISIKQVTFSAGSKAEIYGNLRNLLQTGRLRLTDDPEVLGELASLERKLNQGGSVQIAAPSGQHDDMATVVALAAHEASWMIPPAKPVEPKELTDAQRKAVAESEIHQTCFKQALGRHQAAQRFVHDAEW